MFSPKAKSVRTKAEGGAGAEPKASTRSLLSFNPSNFTKIFKNPTNFVQSTFGNVTGSVLVEHEEKETNPFTIPRTVISPSSTTTSYTVQHKSLVPNGKTRHDKVIPFSTGSPAKYVSPSHSTVHLSSKATTNGGAHVDEHPSIQRYSNSNATASVISTISAISSSNEITSTLSTRTPTRVSKIVTTDSTQSPIIFETVKLNRSPSMSGTVTPLSNMTTFTTETVIPKWMATITPTPCVNNNSMHNQTDTDANHSLINKSSAVIKPMTTNNKNDVAAYRIDGKMSSNDGGLSLFDRNVNIDFDCASKVSNSSELGRNGNVINANNAIRNDISFGPSGTSKSSNNNIDYNSQHCIDQIESNGVYETNANKLDHYSNAGYHSQMPMTGDIVIEHEADRLDSQTLYQLRQQQQQRQQTLQLLQMSTSTYTPNAPDRNENVIAMSSGGTAISTATVNNNSIIDAKKSNTNNGGLLTGVNLSNNSSPSHITNSGNNNTIVTNKYNQNFLLSKSMELHDIQEELYALEEEEDTDSNYDPFVVRSACTKGWNSLPVHKYANYYGSASIQPANNNFSAASFGAASSATLLSASNRNPFLELTVTTSTITPSTTSPFFHQSPSHIEVSVSPLTPSTGNNNNGTCTAFGTAENIFTSLRYDHAAGNGQQQQITFGEQSNQAAVNANLHSEPITPEAIHTLQLFLRQHGTEYIKEFLQVINIFRYWDVGSWGAYGISTEFFFFFFCKDGKQRTHW